MAHSYPRQRSPSRPARHIVIRMPARESSITMSRSASYEPYRSSAPLTHYPATYERSGYLPTRVSSLHSSELVPPPRRSSQQALYPSDDFADYASDTGRLHSGRTNLVNMPTGHRRHHSSESSSGHRNHRSHVDAYDEYIYTTPSEQVKNESNAYVSRLSRFDRDEDRRGLGYYSIPDYGRLREPYTTRHSSPRESERFEREDQYRSRLPVHDSAIVSDRYSRRSFRLEDDMRNLSLRSENGHHVDRLSSHNRRTSREPSVPPGRRSSERDERPMARRPRSILKTPTVRFEE